MWCTKRAVDTGCAAGPVSLGLPGWATRANPLRCRHTGRESGCTMRLALGKGFLPSQRESQRRLGPPSVRRLAAQGPCLRRDDVGHTNFKFDIHHFGSGDVDPRRPSFRHAPSSWPDYGKAKLCVYARQCALRHALHRRHRRPRETRVATQMRLCGWLPRPRTGPVCHPHIYTMYTVYH